MNNSTFETIVAQYHQGDRVTLVRQGSFGFPNTQQVTICGALTIAPYAQHPRALRIPYKGKGKRIAKVALLLPRDGLFIFDGWKDIKAKQPRVEKQGEITVTHYGQCFAPGWMHEVLRLNDATPEHVVGMPKTKGETDETMASNKGRLCQRPAL